VYQALLSVWQAGRDVLVSWRFFKVKTIESPSLVTAPIVFARAIFYKYVIKLLPSFVECVRTCMRAENGPWEINDNLELEETQYGWDVSHSMIYVDQPINTGFSYSEVGLG
jgi:Serine carboxypeptidase